MAQIQGSEGHAEELADSRGSGIGSHATWFTLPNLEAFRSAGSMAGQKYRVELLAGGRMNCSGHRSAPSSGRDVYSGSRTVSITWMTPLLAVMSTAVTVAPLTMTEPSATTKATLEPCAVAAEEPSATSIAITLPGTTW